MKSRGRELNPEVVNCGKASYEGLAAVLLMKALGYKAVLYIKGLNYTLKVVSLTTTYEYALARTIYNNGTIRQNINLFHG